MGKVALAVVTEFSRHRIFNRARRNFSECGGFSVMYNSLILETVIALIYLITTAIITFIIKKRSLSKN